MAHGAKSNCPRGFRVSPACSNAVSILDGRFAGGFRNAVLYLLVEQAVAKVAKIRECVLHRIFAALARTIENARRRLGLAQLASHLPGTEWGQRSLLCIAKWARALDRRLALRAGRLARAAAIGLSGAREMHSIS
jgi:hypothetical protein